MCRKLVKDFLADLRYHACYQLYMTCYWDSVLSSMFTSPFLTCCSSINSYSSIHFKPGLWTPSNIHSILLNQLPVRSNPKGWNMRTQLGHRWISCIFSIQVTNPNQVRQIPSTPSGLATNLAAIQLGTTCGDPCDCHHWTSDGCHTTHGGRWVTGRTVQLHGLWPETRAFLKGV